jgi:SpoIIAA-like
VNSLGLAQSFLRFWRKRRAGAGSIELLKVTGALVVMKLTSSLTKSEFDKAIPLVADVIKLRGRARILVLFEKFKGWSPRDQWSDAAFLPQHEGKVEKIVIVGEDRWRVQAYAFFRSGFPGASVEFYTPDNLDAAYIWLAEPTP